MLLSKRRRRGVHSVAKNWEFSNMEGRFKDGGFPPTDADDDLDSEPEPEPEPNLVAADVDDDAVDDDIDRDDLGGIQVIYTNTPSMFVIQNGWVPFGKG
jgi:hypothetical protein